MFATGDFFILQVLFKHLQEKLILTEVCYEGDFVYDFYSVLSLILWVMIISYILQHYFLFPP